MDSTDQENKATDELRQSLLEYMEYMGWIIIYPTKEDFELLLTEEFYGH